MIHQATSSWPPWGLRLFRRAAFPRITDRDSCWKSAGAGALLITSLAGQRTPHFHNFSHCTLVPGPRDLRGHMKRHSGIKSNKCNQCEYASSEAADLRTHLKTYSGEKSNKCKIMTLIWRMHLWYWKKVSVSVTKILVPEKVSVMKKIDTRKRYRYRKYFVLEKVSVSAKIDTRKRYRYWYHYKF